MKIGVTGSAGFIGMHLTQSLIEGGHEVIGIDSLVPSYGGEWSRNRANYLRNRFDFRTNVLDIANCEQSTLMNLLEDCETIVHLAAWPGVRQGQIASEIYSKNNVLAFSKMLFLSQAIKPKHFLYASSSSVYGDLAQDGPVSESDATGLNLKSYYAATKWMNEIEAQAVQDIVDFPMTALRFFTVYGPWGRPDMAYWNFLERIKKSQEIFLYGKTGGSRNFTYIADCAEILTRIIGSPVTSQHGAINIASGDPMETIDFLNTIADCAKSVAKIQVISRPKVDVEKTWANLEKLSSIIDVPTPTECSKGVTDFVNWYDETVR